MPDIRMDATRSIRVVITWARPLFQAPPKCDMNPDQSSISSAYIDVCVARVYITDI